MKTTTNWLLISSIMFFIMTACSKKAPKDYPVQPVSFTDVQIDDEFWSLRMETNRKVTIPYAFKMCEETGRIDNFAVAGGLMDGKHQGLYFNDSDVYKVIEGAAYSLHLHPDPDLEDYVDGVINKIAAAQEEDGYLYTARTAMTPDKLPPGGEERWSHIQHGHELYCVGHMYEAAVAYYQATGKRSLLDVALKNAELIDQVFEPDSLRYPPGHQEIEIGLARLYRITGEEKYLDLAKFFLDQRGDSTGHELYGEYAQDHLPVIKQEKGVGHAVRAAYLYTGMADIAALTGNQDYIQAIRRIWQDIVGNKLYITGGIGASGGNEGFGKDYHLPNSSAYCETCASIANAMWNQRMFLMTGEAKYMDIVERVIYNSFLSGISMKGDRFFYPNRLQTFTGEERSPWFRCACCPSNVVRFVPSIPGYVYGHKEDHIYVNLFLGSEAVIPLASQTVRIEQKSDYPWSGDIRMTVFPEKDARFTLFVRIPGWAQNRPVPSDLYRYMNRSQEIATIKVNGTPVDLKLEKGYARIKRSWQAGDVIDLSLPMPIRRVLAHDSVEVNLGKVALERGPIVYCAEGPDNEGGSVQNLLLPDDAPLQTNFRKDMLNGIQVIRSRAMGYRFNDDEGTQKVTEQDFLAIPYYAWAHRSKGEMAVWLAREERAVNSLAGPGINDK